MLKEISLQDKYQIQRQIVTVEDETQRYLTNSFKETYARNWSVLANYLVIRTSSNMTPLPPSLWQFALQLIKQRPELALALRVCS